MRTGTRENKAGRWVGSGRRRCGIQKSCEWVGGGRRISDIKFFDDF